MRFALAFLLFGLLAVPVQAQNFGNIPPQTVIGNTDATAKQPAQPVPSQSLFENVVSSYQCYSLIAGPSHCGLYINMTDDPATSANIGLALNVTSTNAPPNSDFNFRYRSALIPSIVMRGNSTSVWAINAGVIVDPDVDLTGKTANMFEGDVHNRNRATGDEPGASGFHYNGPQVTGISIVGTGFRSTYAANVGGLGNVIPTTVSTAGTATSFSTAGNNFAAGDQIRVIVGSATKGQNGTAGAGKVTAATGAGPQALTVVWETASPGAPGVGDWVLAMGQYPTVAPSNTDATFNRGFGCLQGIVQSCFYVYSPVELGLDFNGARTNIGIDFGKMVSLQGGIPTDIRMGLGHRVSMYVANGTDQEVLKTAGNVGDYTILSDGSGNGAMVLGGTGGGGSNSIYRNTAHQFQSRDGSVLFATIYGGGMVLPTLPGSAGAGGLYVCADSNGNFYKKVACP